MDEESSTFSWQLVAPAVAAHIKMDEEGNNLASGGEKRRLEGEATDNSDAHSRCALLLLLFVLASVAKVQEFFTDVAIRSHGPPRTASTRKLHNEAEKKRQQIMAQQIASLRSMVEVKS